MCVIRANPLTAAITMEKEAVTDNNFTAGLYCHGQYTSQEAAARRGSISRNMKHSLWEQYISTGMNQV